MSKKLLPKLCVIRKNYNTQYSLIYILEKWRSTLDKSKHVGAVFMDLSKDLDIINYNLMIAQLEAYGFFHIALSLIF